MSQKGQKCIYTILLTFIRNRSKNKKRLMDKYVLFQIIVEQECTFKIRLRIFEALLNRQFAAFAFIDKFKIFCCCFVCIFYRYIQRENNSFSILLISPVASSRSVSASACATSIPPIIFWFSARYMGFMLKVRIPHPIKNCR